MKRILVLVFSFCLYTCYGQKEQIPKYCNTISIAELKEHVSTLASDLFEGRETGKPGQKLAAEYIRESLADASIKPPIIKGEKTYFQEFNLFESRLDSCFLSSQYSKLVFGKDFFFSSIKEKFSGKIISDLVFVGFGQESDYRGKDVDGKVVIYFEGKPEYSDNEKKKLPAGIYVTSDDQNDIARKNGAAASICVCKDTFILNSLMAMLRPNAVSTMSFNDDGVNSPAKDLKSEIRIGISKAAKLLGIPESDLVEIRSKLNQGETAGIENELMINIMSHRSENNITTENVIGFIEGSEKKDELVLVVAHYDHIGKNGDLICNGADDNASGTAALIEISEAFRLAKKDGLNISRSILFIALTGEEKGLLGSEYYINNSIFPIESVIAVINMDMLGRTDRKHTNDENYVYVYTSESEESVLHNLCLEAEQISKTVLKPEYQYKGKVRLQGGSDHQTFEKMGIPVLYYYTGNHPDYHRPTDTAEKINYEKLQSITQLVFTTTLLVANR